MTEQDEAVRLAYRRGYKHGYEACKKENPGSVLRAIPPVRRRVAQAVGKALYGWGDDEPNTATGFLVRHDVKAVTDAVMAALATPPPAAPALDVEQDFLTLDEWKSIYAVMETEGFGEIADKVYRTRLTDQQEDAS